MAYNAEKYLNPHIEYVENLGQDAMQPHFHNTYHMIFVADGEMELRVDDVHYICKKNTAVFISNLESHYITIREYPYKRYILHFPVNYIHGLLVDSSLFSIFMERRSSFSHVVNLDLQTTLVVEDLLTHMMSECHDKCRYWEQSVASLLWLILISIYRLEPEAFPLNQSSNIVRIISEIQHDISQHISQDMSLESFAGQYYLSSSYLSRSFKNITGYNFRNYLVYHRVSVAKELLLHTDLSITELANKVGYSSVNHFIRIFKQTEGMTPYQYKLNNLIVH